MAAVRRRQLHRVLRCLVVAELPQQHLRQRGVVCLVAGRTRRHQTTCSAVLRTRQTQRLGQPRQPAEACLVVVDLTRLDLLCLVTEIPGTILARLRPPGLLRLCSVKPPQQSPLSLEVLALQLQQARLQQVHLQQTRPSQVSSVSHRQPARKPLKRSRNLLLQVCSEEDPNQLLASLVAERPLPHPLNRPQAVLEHPVSSVVEVLEHRLLRRRLVRPACSGSLLRALPRRPRHPTSLAAVLPPPNRPTLRPAPPQPPLRPILCSAQSLLQRQHLRPAPQLLHPRLPPVFSAAVDLALLPLPPQAPQPQPRHLLSLELPPRHLLLQLPLRAPQPQPRRLPSLELLRPLRPQHLLARPHRACSATQRLLPRPQQQATPQEPQVHRQLPLLAQRRLRTQTAWRHQPWVLPPSSHG